MYPRHLAEPDPERVRALVQARAFATLVSVADGAPFASVVAGLRAAEAGT